MVRWPGILLLIWGSALILQEIFAGDIKLTGPDVVAYHPMIKYLIFGASIAWFTYRAKKPPKIDVHIVADGEQIHIARCNDQVQADEIINAINK